MMSRYPCKQLLTEGVLKSLLKLLVGLLYHWFVCILHYQLVEWTSPTFFYSIGMTIHTYNLHGVKMSNTHFFKPSNQCIRELGALETVVRRKLLVPFCALALVRFVVFLSACTSYTGMHIWITRQCLLHSEAVRMLYLNSFLCWLEYNAYWMSWVIQFLQMITENIKKIFHDI